MRPAAAAAWETAAEVGATADSQARQLLRQGSLQAAKLQRTGSQRAAELKRSLSEGAAGLWEGAGPSMHAYAASAQVPPIPVYLPSRRLP